MAKNIVLLSDGTGNSASSPFKTNVWRLYQALDVTPPIGGAPEQIVFYNNGVGTETFRPLALLGMALGIGVAFNIKNLYKFLCRNYEPGDNIYLFGFSRGAFTIRLLAGLILRCGLVTATDDAELKDRIELAYAEYMRDSARRATRTRPWLLLGYLLGAANRDADRVTFEFPDHAPQHFPRIAFIGVWDTVDAYGMPVDELKMGIDRYVWPMTLAERKLSDHVDRACHALSLDDERPTFRPVLWTDPAPDEDPSRLLQVWFAGVHANVGGGYPDDGLSCVALQWMMDEAEESGLRLFRRLRTQYDDQADPHGEQYDSRAGLAGYYRYGPRNVDNLCHDKVHDVEISRPNIHASVMARIGRWQVAYAPVSFPRLPRGYAVVGRAPTAPMLVPPALETKDNKVETEAALEQRTERMEWVDDAVFRRCVAYFITVAFTAALAVLPAIDRLCSSAPPGSGSQSLGTWLEKAGPYVPAWTKPWLDSFAIHPVLFLFCSLTVGWFFFWRSQRLEEEILARAEYAWGKVRRAEALGEPASTLIDRCVRRLRENAWLGAAYKCLSRRFIPFLFALAVALPVGGGMFMYYLFSGNRRRRRAHKVGWPIDALPRIRGVRRRTETEVR